MRKPVFWVCDQVRLKPACLATEPSSSLEILDLERRDIILSLLYLGPNIHLTSNNGTCTVFIGDMLSWLSFHNFVC